MENASTISVLAFHEGDCWSAQCLEYDIATQAATLPDLFYEVERVLMGHLVVAKELGREPFARLSPAPHRYWTMYEQASLTVHGKRHSFRAAVGATITPDLRVTS